MKRSPEFPGNYCRSLRTSLAVVYLSSTFRNPRRKDNCTMFCSCRIVAIKKRYVNNLHPIDNFLLLSLQEFQHIINRNCPVNGFPATQSIIFLNFYKKLYCSKNITIDVFVFQQRCLYISRHFNKKTNNFLKYLIMKFQWIFRQYCHNFIKHIF